MLEKKIWTLIDVIKWGTEFFKNKAIESPRLNIELLLCSVLNFDRISIYTNFQKPLSDNELAWLRNAVIQRAKRVPIQYITHHSDFCGLKLFVDNNVLIPRPETELLVQEIINNHDSDDEINILDIGCGSGCIGLALAKNFCNSKVFALDNNQKTLEIAKKNALANNIKNIDFQLCDILTKLPENNDFHIIVSNPPYISALEYELLELEVKQYEPIAALTDKNDGYTFYKRFADIIPEIIIENGFFYFEIGFEQKKIVTKLLSELSIELNVKEDFANIPRIVWGQYNKIDLH